jgi:molybdopterin biosynthesis enzyme
MGHMPVLGEWFALPLLEAAGSKQVGDTIFNEIFHPIAVKLIDHCDAVLRIGGASSGADEMVKTGAAKGKIIFLEKANIPTLI